jgi:hypothetical protein
MTRGLDNAGIVSLAYTQVSEGQSEVALALLEDLLSAMAKKRFGGLGAYRPGDVARLALGPLGINIDARASEYRRVIEALLPGVPTEPADRPVLYLLDMGIEPVALEGPVAEAAAAILSGATFESALQECFASLEAAAAIARAAELDWLLDAVVLHYQPDAGGFADLWRRAASVAGVALKPGLTLSQEQTEPVLVRMVGARYEDDVIRALASGLRS